MDTIERMKEQKNTIPVMVPIRCKDCCHLKGKMEDGAMILDRCYVYDCEITDEMLDEPCRFYVKYVWPPREAKE